MYLIDRKEGAFNIKCFFFFGFKKVIEFSEES